MLEERFKLNPLKKTNLGVVQASFDAFKMLGTRTEALLVRLTPGQITSSSVANVLGRNIASCLLHICSCFTHYALPNLVSKSGPLWKTTTEF